MDELQQTPGTPKEIVRAIRIFFMAIISGSLIFTGMVLFLDSIGTSTASVKDGKNIFLFVAAGIAVICFGAAWTGYNKGIAAAKDSLISLTGKLNLYRTTLIKYVALCEMPALFGIIAFYVTGNYLTLVITAAMLAAMLIKAPVKKRIVDDLALDWKQQNEI